MFRAGNRLYTISKQVTGNETAKQVILDGQKHFPKLTLNNPKALNSLSLSMIRQIEALLPELNKTKAFWIEGAGGKAFCAGGDVKSLYLNRESNPKLLSDFFREEFILDYKLTKLNSIQVSNWDGIVMGGGVGLSVFSPFRIATENTVFAMPETKIGFFTDVCGGYFLSRLPNNIGYYLGLTGTQLKGEDVFKAGIANYYVSRDNLPKIFEEIKRELVHSNQPKETIKNILRSYKKQISKPNIDHEDDIRYIFNSNSVEDILDKLEQKKGDPFFAKVKQLIQQKCPISVCVTFESIKRSKNMEMRDCFETDYAVSQRFMEGKDFFEGVRCTLVDKGAKPKWTHGSTKDVPKQEVLKYFKPLPQDKRLGI